MSIVSVPGAEAGGVHTGQWEGCETVPWIQVDESISTAHPYGENSSYEYTINTPAGAIGIRVHFRCYEKVLSQNQIRRKVSPLLQIA